MGNLEYLSQTAEIPVSEFNLNNESVREVKIETTPITQKRQNQFKTFMLPVNQSSKKIHPVLT
jgi:hypothetical protein